LTRSTRAMAFPPLCDTGVDGGAARGLVNRDAPIVAEV